MNCPNCGTWNPEDKRFCWRCDAVLPKPEPPKPKRKPINWMWIAVGIFVVFALIQACSALTIRQPQPALPPDLRRPVSTPLVWAVATPIQSIPAGS
jgi:hypothetical protein